MSLLSMQLFLYLVGDEEPGAGFDHALHSFLLLVADVVLHLETPRHSNRNQY